MFSSVEEELRSSTSSFFKGHSRGSQKSVSFSEEISFSDREDDISLEELEERFHNADVGDFGEDINEDINNNISSPIGGSGSLLRGGSAGSKGEVDIVGFREVPSSNSGRSEKSASVKAEITNSSQKSSRLLVVTPPSELDLGRTKTRNKSGGNRSGGGDGDRFKLGICRNGPGQQNQLQNQKFGSPISPKKPPLFNFMENNYGDLKTLNNSVELGLDDAGFRADDEDLRVALEPARGRKKATRRKKEERTESERSAGAKGDRIANGVIGEEVGAEEQIVNTTNHPRTVVPKMKDCDQSYENTKETVVRKENTKNTTRREENRGETENDRQSPRADNVRSNSKVGSSLNRDQVVREKIMRGTASLVGDAALGLVFGQMSNSDKAATAKAADISTFSNEETNRDNAQLNIVSNPSLGPSLGQPESNANGGDPTNNTQLIPPPPPPPPDSDNNYSDSDHQHHLKQQQQQHYYTGQQFWIDRIRHDSEFKIIIDRFAEGNLKVVIDGLLSCQRMESDNFVKWVKTKTKRMTNFLVEDSMLSTIFKLTNDDFEKMLNSQIRMQLRQRLAGHSDLLLEHFKNEERSLTEKREEQVGEKEREKKRREREEFRTVLLFFLLKCHGTGKGLDYY